MGRRLSYRRRRLLFEITAKMLDIDGLSHVKMRILKITWGAETRKSMKYPMLKCYSANDMGENFTKSSKSPMLKGDS